jgi:hypothetical protein
MTKQQLQKRTQAYIKKLGLSIRKINMGEQPNPLPLKKPAKEGEKPCYIVGNGALKNAYYGYPLTNGQFAILELFFNQLNDK